MKKVSHVSKTFSGSLLITPAVRIFHRILVWGDNEYNPYTNNCQLYAKRLAEALSKHSTAARMECSLFFMLHTWSPEKIANFALTSATAAALAVNIQELREMRKAHHTDPTNKLKYRIFAANKIYGIATNSALLFDAARLATGRIDRWKAEHEWVREHGASDYHVFAKKSVYQDTFEKMVVQLAQDEKRPFGKWIKGLPKRLDE